MRKQKGSNKANAGQKEVEKKGGCAGEQGAREGGSEGTTGGGS